MAGIAVERVADGIVLPRDVEVRLRHGQHKEIGTRARGHQLHRLGILLAGNAVAHRLGAPCPSQAVVPQQTLLVPDGKGHAAVAVRRPLELVLAVEIAAHEQRAACKPHVLTDVYRKVGAQLVLPHKNIGTIGLRYLAHLSVQRGRAAERHRRQVVGLVVAEAPLRRLQCVTCRQCVGRLFLCHPHRLGERQLQGVRRHRPSTTRHEE